MTIEIHQPRLEALIEQRMASGHFQSIEDLLLQTLETSTDRVLEFSIHQSVPVSSKRSLVDVFEPIRGLLTDEEVDTLFRRDPSPGRTIDLS